jgi:plasmid maintenance system antidote protein VapI
MEDSQVYFWTALRHCYEQGEYPTQDSLAIEVGVATSTINQQLNRSKTSSPRLQAKIARAFGFELVDFLNLGKTLQQRENGQETSRLPRPTLQADNPAKRDKNRRGILEVFLDIHPEVDPEVHREERRYYLANKRRTRFENGARFMADLETGKTIITATMADGQPAYQTREGVFTAPGPWGPPWIIGRIVLSAEEE